MGRRKKSEIEQDKLERCDETPDMFETTPPKKEKIKELETVLPPEVAPKILQQTILNKKISDINEYLNGTGEVSEPRDGNCVTIILYKSPYKREKRFTIQLEQDIKAIRAAINSQKLSG